MSNEISDFQDKPKQVFDNYCIAAKIWQQAGADPIHFADTSSSKSVLTEFGDCSQLLKSLQTAQDDLGSPQKLIFNNDAANQLSKPENIRAKEVVITTESPTTERIREGESLEITEPVAKQYIEQIVSQFSGREAEAVKQNLIEFYCRAQDNGVSREQIERTLVNVNKILAAPNESSLSENSKRTLAFQLVERLAHPELVRQGNHDTCGSANLEMAMLMKNPEQISGLIADIADQKKFKGPDAFAYVNELPNTYSNVPDSLQSRFGVTPSQERSKMIYIDDTSLKPDGDPRRCYLDQIAQVALQKAAYEAREFDGDKELVPFGSVIYVQTASNPRNSGERVATTTENGEHKSWNGMGRGQGGNLYPSELQYLSTNIGLRPTNEIMLARVLHSGEELDSFSTGTQYVDSTEQMCKQLKKLKDENNLPMIIQVLSAGLPHLVSVMDIQGDKLKIFNPQSGISEATVQEVFKNMAYEKQPWSQ